MDQYIDRLILFLDYAIEIGLVLFVFNTYRRQEEHEVKLMCINERVGMLEHPSKTELDSENNLR